MRVVSIVFLALAAACGGSSTPSNQYSASLSYTNEIPPTSSTGTGTATYTVNGTTVDYTITYQNLTGKPTNAHIHVGASTVTGGTVVVPFSNTLFPATPSGSWSGSFTASDIKAGTNGSTTIAAGSLDDLINALKAGNTYTNVHTAANPNGEIRGQNHP
jgi:hypothetical protein